MPLPPSITAGRAFALVLVALFITTAFGQTPANVTLNKPVTLNGTFPGFVDGVCGAVPEPAASSVNNGIFQPEMSCYVNGIYWSSANQNNRIEINFGGTYLIDSAIVQADNNDTYQLSYLGTDGQYHNWWSIPTQGSFGLSTRPGPDQTTRQSLPPVLATGVAIFAPSGSGDGLYGVSQISVFGIAQSTSPTNGFMNGTFSANSCSVPAGRFAVLAPGNSCISGWTSGSGTTNPGSGAVNLTDSGFWQAPAGTLSVDLDGSFGPGSISQTFNTTPGATYTVTFAHSGNPTTASPVKKLLVSGPGASATYTYDTSIQQNTVANMKYLYETFSFTASANSSTLTFASQDAVSSVGGPVIGNIDVSVPGATGSSCTYTLSASSASVGPAASTGSVNVTTRSGCTFTASAPSGSFASITSGVSYSGSQTVAYNVQANSSPTRATTLAIAGLSFTINQFNGCLFGLTPSSVMVPATGAATTFLLGTSSSTCTFTATSNNPSFLFVNGSGQGAGNSAVSYTVLPNSSSIGRTGSISVAGKTFTVIEAGTVCTYALAQASQAFTSAGGTGTASVQAPAGCTWSVQNASPFVTVTSGVSGSGNGTITYNIQPNTGTAQRTASLTIAGLPYAITESGASLLTCTSSAGPTAQAALEGRTEIVGDLILTCSGLTAPLAADISLTLNTNVTNAISINTNATDAVLLVNEANPSNGTISGNGTLDWPAVTLAPLNGSATVRIKNVRADASLLAVPASLQSVPITGTVRVNAAVAVPVVNASQVLAYAGPSLLFPQVITQGAQTTIPVQFQEAAVAAFHPDGTTPATRFRLVVSNIPTTVQVLAPVFPAEGASKAQLVSADASGLGGTAFAGVGPYQLLTKVGSTATATWVVLSSDPATFEVDTFPLQFQNATAQDLAQIQVAGSLAPVSTVSIASTTAPVPRFRDFSSLQSLVNLRTRATAQGPSASLVANGTTLAAHFVPLAVGSNGTFTNQVTNDNQDTPATGVIVGSKVTGGTIANCQSTLGTCSTSGDQVSVTIGMLPPMQAVTVTVTVVPAPCPAGTCAVQNDVTALSDQPNADLNASGASTVFFVGVTPPSTPNIVASAGTPQTTPAGTPFAVPLQVTLTDAQGNPMANQTVSFTAPASGASAALSGGTAATNASGIASVTAIANGTQGSYLVTASVAGLSVSFSLTNTPPTGTVPAVRQSSTLPGTPPASAAFDGNTNGNFSSNSVTATNLEANPWWQVDLGTSKSIASVVVWNRTDCCADRLSDYWLFVSDTPFLDSDTPAILQSRNGTFASHQTTAPNPSTSIAVNGQGRYVRIQLNSANYLSLAEVQVIAGDTSVGATQSSTLPGTPAASAALDGSTNGNFSNNSVTATNLEINPWWQVNLGSSMPITSIVIWNRTDCCGERLSDYWVFVSDTPFLATDTPATLQNRAGTFASHQTSQPNPFSVITANTQGRYVRVQLSGANYLSLAEVQVNTGPLIGIPTVTQSSTLAGASADRAVDGNTNGAFSSGSVTATTFEANPWWQQDLGSSKTINTVTIWNRTDCCSDRLGDYWLFVSDTPFLTTDTPATLQHRAGTFASHQMAIPSPAVTIPVGAQGRYLRIQLDGTGYLSLAEVQVSASGGTPKVASQSSTLPGTPPASVAIDGITDGNFFDGSVTATNLENNPWWQVDLGAATPVNAVTIWNRTDCCGSRLTDYWIFVSSTPFLPTDTPATLQNRAGTFASHQTVTANPSVTIPVGIEARYVRVQLNDTDFLSLAEVQVR